MLVWTAINGSNENDVERSCWWGNVPLPPPNTVTHHKLFHHDQNPPRNYTTNRPSVSDRLRLAIVPLCHGTGAPPPLRKNVVSFSHSWICPWKKILRAPVTAADGTAPKTPPVRLWFQSTSIAFMTACLPAADLGMFAMFGRTGAPTKKKPPQEKRQLFCNIATCRK